MKNKTGIRKILKSEFNFAYGHFLRMADLISDLIPTGQSSFKEDYRFHLAVLCRELYELSWIIFSRGGPQEAPQFSDEIEELLSSVKEQADFGLSLTSLPNLPETQLIVPLKMINALYSSNQFLHQLLEEYDVTDLPIPRGNLINVEYQHNVYAFDQFSKKFDGQQWPSSGELRYFLPESILTEENCWGSDDLFLVSDRREKKHKSLIKTSLQAITQKNYPEAQENLEKAASLNGNAQVFTMLGWVHGLQGNTEMAKQYCLMAIKKDPDYGPPFNDYGSYLLEEGNCIEAIQWFEKAKKASTYDNREYPYINSGRAYLQLKKYELALQEFKVAKAMVPWNKKVLETYEKLQQLFLLKEGKKNAFDSGVITP